MKAVFRRSKPPRADTPARSKDLPSSRDPAQLAQNDFKSDLPIVGNWDSAHTTIGAGVAIFHLATSRVVLCYHSVDNYWFLPKGRRDCGEDSGVGAVREGFEESGYRNRLLPLPIHTRQPKAYNSSNARAVSTPMVTEPVWTQLAPVSRSAQYILFWYIAETLPPDLEASLSVQESEQDMAYQYPPKFELGLTLKQRIAMEGAVYEPIRHANTGVDEEEALYESSLMPVEEAIAKLGSSISADVVRKGWEAICLRRQMEDKT